MANIGNISSISGWQGTPETCGNVGIYDLRNHINKVFVADPSMSSGYLVQIASAANGAFATVKNFECGSSYIFFRNPSSSSTFNIPGFAQGNVENNQGRVTTFYPTEFVIQGKGTFHITTMWNQESPVYKTANGSHMIWFNGSTYVLSSGVNNNSNALQNGSVLPNISYGDNQTSSATIVVDDFTGSSVGANGLYVEVGYYNDQKLYRHALTGNYYYFFNGSVWVLTDTPINTSGSACYINGTSELTGRLNNSNGSNGRCFDGQSGRVMDGGMDPRSLATEDELSLMSTEDKLKVLITEED
tara:strand:+ start:538 stop:1440 length:903 start_codon:yes stop_codon:yes gene_type:complete